MSNPNLAGFTDISNGSLSVEFTFFSKEITGLSSGGWTTTSLQKLEAYLAANPIAAAFAGLTSVQSQLAPVQSYLSPNTLGVQFNLLWQSIAPTQVNTIKKQIVTTAQTNGMTVSNVNVTYPASGTLWGQAGVQQVFPPPESGPKEFGVVNMMFDLPGWDVTFDSAALGHTQQPAWDVSFDVDIEITTEVPIRPMSLNFTAVAEASNAQMNTDNLAAEILGDADSILSWLTSGFDSGWDAPVPNIFNTVEGDVDSTSQGVNVAGLNTLAQSLNGTGNKLVGVGFTECAFSIAGTPPGLTLTLTHPRDPAPALRNANDLQGTLFIPPSLAASESEVKPGATIALLGSNFPVDTMTQLTVEWPNTSTGIPAGASVKYRLVGNEASEQTLPVSQPSPLGGMYSFTALPLTANTKYEFMAQCADVLTWSHWSTEWLLISTSTTNVVNVVLASSPDGPGLTIGSAGLPQTAAPWAYSVQIPTGTAAGTYYLLAENAGEIIASTPIVVASSLQPILQMVDTSTTPPTIVTSPLLAGGAVFTVRGEDFLPGSAVTVELNGVAVGTPTAPPSGDFELAITLPGNENTGSNLFDVTATGAGGQSASLPPFSTIGPSK